ncbi:MAG TPA: hypothetical protein VJ926_03320 [Patescibacteria group bacterium]|nr:hypothetical protein [Patescibacteria group bacterium]
MNIRKKLKNSLIFSIILVFVFSFFAVNVSFAQESKESVNLSEFKNMILEVSADNTDTVNNLQIFWHDLKDTIDLAFTFNKTKKIEKELKYAEKRIRWANVLSSFDSQDKKDLAFELSAKADEYVNNIVDRSDNIFNEVDEREKNILENILIHQDNKAKVWENLESSIAVENSEDFMRIREQVERKQQDFMETMASNNGLSDDLRNRFQKQVQKTKQIRENRKNFVEINRKQLDNLNVSNNSDLKEFLEKRRQEMMHFNEEFQKEFADDSSENKQNRNNQSEDKGQNRLQNNNSDDMDMPEIDINSPEYQEFLRMLDSSQPVSDVPTTDIIETVE